MHKVAHSDVQMLWLQGFSPRHGDSTGPVIVSPMHARPNVLVLSGHDPTGGAGFQADIEAVAALGCHGAGMLTALTRQDTHNAYGVWPTEPEAFAGAVDTLLADMAFAAVKIGLLGTPEQAATIAEWLQARAELPVVVDPVLRAGGGATLAADPVAGALRDTLLAHTTLLTPNAAEARLLCDGLDDLQTCGERLSRLASWVLVTGGDEPDEVVTNRLFHDGILVEQFEWPRVTGPFHGSGCTLSAAAAACLARGEPMADAVTQAQRYTHACLASAFSPGAGQRVPSRVRSNP